MSVKIKAVKKWSGAFFKGIKAEDVLISINGNEINDFLDYQFYLKDESVTLTVARGDKQRQVRVRKNADEDIGLEFDSYLMDEQKRCKNKCIFCFIDQNPPGMRESIYFKDDDSRLSFLFGNYITLTNLTDKDIDRIIKMHISPVNISVHTMNKQLRVKMMSNKRAGECLDYIRRLAEAGITINTQLVLCPGINDGSELELSLNELSAFYPQLQSIAAVPVGVTKHRCGLYDMPEYTQQSAGEVIDAITAFGERFKEKHGTRLAYAADEFYLKAQRQLPGEAYYEAYPQIENGVGMWRNLREEFFAAMDCSDGKKPEINRLSLATGLAAYPLMKELSEAFCRKYGIQIDVFGIENNFFGPSITVAGLVTAGDIINQLRDKSYADTLLIPDTMLRSERDLFLDNISVQELESELGVRLRITDCSGSDLFEAFMGN